MVTNVIGTAYSKCALDRLIACLQGQGAKVRVLYFDSALHPGFKLLVTHEQPGDELF